MTETQIPNVNPDDILLQVRNLKKHFPITGGLFRRTVGHVKAVDGVSFYIKRGETLGLVGESGCGKTTCGRTVLRLDGYDPTDGEIIFDDPKLGKVHVESLEQGQMKAVRPNMQIIFQDPFSSLDPRMTLERIVSEPMVINRTLSGQALRNRVGELLELVGLRSEYMTRYPHAFSGGQRQRIGIARALALNPQLIICDEPVSALDVSVQAQVINLLEELQAQLALTYLFIAHDLSVVEHISDRVAVMYVGFLVEMAATDELYYNPRHPYTEALMAAIPKPDPRVRTKPIKLPGEVASPANPPTGCYFHPRCRYAQAICSQERPLLRDVGGEHWVACHLAEELALQGLVTQKVMAEKSQPITVTSSSSAPVPQEAVTSPVVIAQEPAAEPPDDMERIEGIGPRIARLLQEQGIRTFAQLAATQESRLREILIAARLQHIAQPATWPEQAALAARGDWDALQALQDQLKGGKRD